MNIWNIATGLYVVLAVFTLVPVLMPLWREVKLPEIESSFSCPHHFSPLVQERWNAYRSGILATLRSWKKHSMFYTRFHYYYVGWTLVSPIIVAAIASGGEGAKVLLITISSHLLLTINSHRQLKVGENLRAFRLAESELFDLNRGLQHQPEKYGETEEEQLKKYKEAAEDIRKQANAAQTLGLPNVEHGDN